MKAAEGASTYALQMSLMAASLKENVIPTAQMMNDVVAQNALSLSYTASVAAASNPNWKPLPNADNKPLPWPRKAAYGADFMTSGPQLLLVGDNAGGREHVKVPPSRTTPAGGDTVVNVHIHARSARRTRGLANSPQVGRRDLMRGVMRGMVGQNG